MIDQTTPTVGKLLDSTAGRDAIHFALAPVVAAERLLPCQRVQLDDAGRAVAGPESIGLVDPFLTAAVQPGERFWLFLYPGTITALRHVWVHPAFAPKVPKENA